MNNGGPAFPLRDWFAGMALQGYIAASACYQFADAMLKERARDSETDQVPQPQTTGHSP